MFVEDGKKGGTDGREARGVRGLWRERHTVAREATGAPTRGKVGGMGPRQLRRCVCRGGVAETAAQRPRRRRAQAAPPWPCLLTLLPGGVAHH